MTTHTSILSNLTSLRRQLLGAAILLKTLLPPIILGVLLISVIAIVSAINRLINDSIAHITRHSAGADRLIAEIRAEGDRIHNEIYKIQMEGKRFAGEVNRAIKPVRSSVNNAWNSLKAISNTIEKTINTIIKSVNKLILAKKLKLKPLNLPDIRIPKIPLPNLNLNIDLEADLSAVYALRDAAQALQEDLKQTAQDLVSTLGFWLGVMKLIVYLTGIWLLLVIVGFFIRMKARLVVGVKLLSGENVNDALIYF